jgi:hypothetical protein
MLFSQYFNFICYKIIVENTAPKVPPIIGAITRIHEYPQSESPLSGIGNSACAILGPKSLARLIALYC